MSALRLELQHLVLVRKRTCCNRRVGLVGEFATATVDQRAQRYRVHVLSLRVEDSRVR